MTVFWRWGLMLLACVSAASPALADDVSATGRGVVRVVTIAMADNQVVGFGHGSGVAVAPNRIVTNAHVVELQQKYPDNVVIGVVPSEGSKSYQGKVIAFDAARDLALIEFDGAPLPSATLYSGSIDEGGAVTALGYPGNVDVATAQSASDYIHPLSPIRSEGVFSGARTVSGVHVLLHTAGIARGNSGGPLLDPCGRVIGINSAITHTENGDASFGFAIAESELVAFLREANQPVATVGSPCTSMADTLRADSAADAQNAAFAETQQRDAAARMATEQADALNKSRDEAEHNRENVMALAALMLALGALVTGGGGMLEVKGQRPWAIGIAVAGATLIAGSIAVFLARPESQPSVAPYVAPSPAALPTSGDAALGKLACTFVPERSRVTVSDTGDIPLDWGAGGCVNGRTQYVGENGRWSRALVPDNEETVSVLQFDPASRAYSNTRYLLSQAEMDRVRAVRAQAEVKACTTDPGTLRDLSAEQSAIRAALPQQPNEKLVYACKAATP